MKRTLILFLASLAVLAPATATAFCGFYVAGGDAKLFNDATQVVLLRDEKTTVLSMQNNYEGPTEDFAMVVPVPQVLEKDRVKTLDKEVFDRVDQLSAPRLVEYWERDPCAPNFEIIAGDRRSAAFGFGGLGLSGSGRGGGGYVKVEAQFEVGEYDIVILSTNDSTALDGWLKDNKYKIPAGAEPYFRPYVEKGSYFFVARVDAQRVEYENGKAVLSPLRFHYESEEFQLPVRLGMINSKGKQDLLVYILGHNQRYEVANYPNVTIPTNVEVGPVVRDGFGEFYEALFSRTIEENPRAVVTEYSWAAAKCDPCPSGLLGGAGLRPQDIETLGNDIVKKADVWNTAGWTLTRLHARYAPDDIGEDLVFQKADPIAGGREVYTAGRDLEKGSVPSSVGNNFQGRYIIRHEWEGKVECDKPARGQWGPPPNPMQMALVRDTVVEELRRQQAVAAGRELTEEDLEAPPTAAEQKAIAHHMRKRFGTSWAPKAAEDGPSTAPSANTRTTSLRGGAQLAAMVKEAIPELKIQPTESDVTFEEPAPQNAPSTAAQTGTSVPASSTAGPGKDKENWPPGDAKCSTATTASGTNGLAVLLLALIAFARRRR